MFHLKKIYLLSNLLLLFTFVALFSSITEAKEFSNYSSKEVLKKLPEKYQNANYFYEQNNDGYIQFAGYDGKKYCMTVKHASDSSLYSYCVNYSKHITMNTLYKEQKDLFDPQLRTRIGIALRYGSSSWNTLANKSYTTGNSITDYYMTQIVIHSLIYHFSNQNQNYGIDHTKLDYFDDTAILKKKTKALYNLCSKATIQFTNGELENCQFSFSSNHNKLCLKEKTIESSQIDCNIAKDNAKVTEYQRNLEDLDYLGATIESKGSEYNSSFQVKFPVQAAEQLEPGIYHVSVNETVQFQPYIASFWSCTDKSIKNDNQEITELSVQEKNVSDTLMFDFIVGGVTLKKTDSISGVIIPDAEFEIQQYNDVKKQYESYKQMKYNTTSNVYESGNLYILESNKKALFKIIEKKPGKYYKNDWDGQVFQLSEENHVFHFNVDNEPILGSLIINKVGDCPSFHNAKLSYKPYIAMSNVTFTLYAANDIYLHNKCIYKMNQKIMDLVTNDKGIASADELLAGEYYIKEKETSSYHILDEKDHHFTIAQDQDRKYTQYILNLENKVKKCSISLYKYTNDVKQNIDTKIPLKGAKFGLYAANDMMDFNHACIAKKDELLAEGITDEKGNLIFTELLYDDYYLKELEAPKGYLINESIIPISKQDFQSEDHTNYILSKECFNQPKRFQLHLLKTGEQLNEAKTKTSDIGSYTTYETIQTPLKSVTFQIYDKNTNQLISEQKTNKEGTVSFQNLLAGEYYIIEKSAPAQYIRNSNPVSITISNDSYNDLMAKQLSAKQNLEVNDETYGFSLQPIINQTLSNNYFTTKITLLKQGENAKINKKGLYYSFVPLKDVVYGLYQDFDYIINDKCISPKDTCVGYLKTNENGIATLNTKLPSGNYYLKELKTTTGYELDNTKHLITIQSNQNQNLNLDLTNSIKLINKLSKASVTIHKTDSETKKPLKKVEFTLYNHMDEKIGVYKTDRKGNIVVNDLPYGQYYFVETKCNNGYYSTNNKYNFTLDSSKTVKLNITNQPILKLGFQEPYKFILIGLFVFTLSILWVLSSVEWKNHE